MVTNKERTGIKYRDQKQVFFSLLLSTNKCTYIIFTLGVRRTASQILSLQHFPTQHDMLPQNFVCKNELNCEYCNITLARNNEAL